MRVVEYDDQSTINKINEQCKSLLSNDDDCKVVISPDRSKLRVKVDSFGDRDMLAD